MGRTHRSKRIWGLAARLAALSLLAGAFPPRALAMPQGGYAHPEILIQAEELKALLDRQEPGLKVVDVRHKAKYYLGHIPGAVQVWRHRLQNRRGRFTGLALPAEQLEKLLGGLGISDRDTLVIYSDQFEHARLWWLLAYQGFPLSRMRLLDGGLEAWKARGYPVQLSPPPVTATSFKLPADGGRPYLAADLEEVRRAAASQGKVIVDTRSKREFSGQMVQEGAARSGHIPGAVSVDWRENKVPQGPYRGYWKSAAELAGLYRAAGVSPEKEVYLYEHNSHQGLSSTFALVSLYLLGYPLERLHLYPGGWLEWSRTVRPSPAKPEVSAAPLRPEK